MDDPIVAELRSELESDRTVQLELLAEHGAEPYDEMVTDLGVGDEEGFADSARATEERSETLGMLEAARARVHAIDDALHRIEDGSYGTCADCGTTIPTDRLRARPSAIRCVTCSSAA
jgi:DnaK suppressor protein